MFGGDPTYNFIARPATLGPSYSVAHDATMNAGFSEYSLEGSAVTSASH